jgi:hypothetical protein
LVEYYLESLNESNSIKWETFNNNSIEGSFFHNLKWRQIFENLTRSKTNYFLLYKNNTIIGIFPFIEQNVRLFKGYSPIFEPPLHFLMKDYSEISDFKYFLKTFQVINDKKISFICFSTLHKEIFNNSVNFPVFPYRDFADFGNMTLNLLEYPPEKIWANFSRKKGQKKYIRRFEEKGFQINEVTSYDDLKRFYKYYQENLEFIHGTRYPFSHFVDLWNILSRDEMRITLLSKNSLISGGLLMFTYKPQNTVYFQYLSINRKLPPYYHPTYYLFWEAINWAWMNKYEKVSFGAQHFEKNNNPRYRIKSEFGAKFEPLHSRIISLTKIFTLSYKCKRFMDRVRFKNYL